MKDNLTQQAKLIHKVEGTTGRARYHKVVYRETSSGNLWVATVAPEKMFKPTLLQRAYTYITYEVSGEPELIHRFTRPFQTIDGIHDFTLSFEIFFRVVDPKVVVESEHLDPLREIEKHAVREIGGTATRLPWSVIWDGGSEFETQIRDLRDRIAGNILKPELALDEKAQHWGLEVHRVHVDRTLPEGAISPHDKASVGSIRETQGRVVKLYADQEVRLTEIDLEADAKRLQQVRDTELLAQGTMAHLIQNLQGVLDNASRQLRTIPQLSRAVQDLQGLKEQLLSISSPLELAGSTSASDTGSAAQLLASSTPREQPESGLTHVLGEILLHLVDVPRELLRGLTAPALGLISETLLDRDPDLIRHYRRDLEQGLDEHLSQLSQDQINLVRRIGDQTRLRDRLGLEESS